MSASLCRIRFLLTVVITVFGLTAPASAQLAARLEADRASYDADDALKLRFTLTNDSQEPMTVLKWSTPFAGFDSDMFQIEQDGEAVKYIGAVVRRAAPQPDDYITIGPGETAEVDVDLREGYDIYRDGAYSAEFQSRLLQADSADSRTLAAREFGEPRAMRSNAVSFELSEARPRSERATVEVRAHTVEPTKRGLRQAREAEARPATYRNCSSSERSATDSAKVEGEDISLNATFALAFAPIPNRPTAQRYVTWFGAHTDARYQTATDNFTNVYDALRNRQVVFDCDCDPAFATAYAYVFPTVPYEIYLCGAFWPAPLAGANSKADTLVHEVSHFNVVADTDDVVYGQTGSKNLASSNPDSALNNADNYAYFAANPGNLDMGPAAGLELLLLSVLLALIVVIAARRWLRSRYASAA